MNLKAIVSIVILLLMAIQNVCAAEMTRRGKVIDADTLKPIEGAVVVARWNEARGTIAGDDTRIKDVKETLTDKNGKWSIKGPEGDEDKLIGILKIMGKFITQDPVFIIYKPGYRGTIRGGFLAYPYIDKDHNLEGIVLVRVGETREERKEFTKKFPVGVPFIPIKDPEKKLRELDFSFQYPENVKMVGSLKKEVKILYQVIGLRKAKTKEERLRAQPSPPTEDVDKLPILYKVINEENKSFGLEPIGRGAQ